MWMLFRGITATSAVVTIFLYGFHLIEKLYWIPVAFMGCFLALFIGWCFSCVICTRFIKLDQPCCKHSCLFRFYANCIIDSLMQILRIRLHVTGLELVPTEKFLLVGNHRSALDPILEMGVFRKHHIGFVAKQELFSIPIIGKIMHRCFCIPLDRGSLRDGLQMMRQAAETIENQTASMGIYPEGTRGKGPGLLPFKSGAFKIAKKAKCPVVVATIRNSEQIGRRAPFRRTDVYLDIVGVLQADEIAGIKTAQLSKVVFQMMEKSLLKSASTVQQVCC